jgi:hypothetical protein
MTLVAQSFMEVTLGSIKSFIYWTFLSVIVIDEYARQFKLML